MNPLSIPIRWLRNRYFAILQRSFQTDDGRAILAEALDGHFNRDGVHSCLAATAPLPYPELGSTAGEPAISDRSDIIILTGRFRSGSTLLWNLFRNVGGCTAYYEPLNERRWFDMAGDDHHTDPSHRHVADYWREYQGLNALADVYDESWIRRRLFLTADAWAPRMKAYVDALIDTAPGRPVLQFNRIDLRLPWFKRHYPNATFIHIYRHPRDQWCSTLMGDLDRVPLDLPAQDFERFDRFYLRLWVQDLQFQFPFLADRAVEHPYQQFYYLWRLSYNMGAALCDHSVCFEELARQPAIEIPALLQAAGIQSYDLDALLKLIAPPDLGKWDRFASDDWFARHEAACEQVLADFFRGQPHARTAGPTPLESVNA